MKQKYHIESESKRKELFTNSGSQNKYFNEEQMKNGQALSDIYTFNEELRLFRPKEQKGIVNCEKDTCIKRFLGPIYNQYAAKQLKLYGVKLQFHEQQHILCE